MAYLGKSPSQGVRNRYYFTASGGETSISGALTGGTLTFTDGNYVDVNLNGVTLVAGTDYNTSTANTIAGLSALTASDVVEIVVYDVFSVFGGNVNGPFTISGNLSVDNGTIKLDGNHPVGTQNVALGDTALDSNTTGGRNTAIGANAMTTYNVTDSGNDFNVAVGYNSLTSLTTGFSNTGVGSLTLESTTTGANNTACGYGALDSNTTANNNTAVGYDALTANTTGPRNVALGYEAAKSNTTGDAGTALGYEALRTNTTGNYNTAVGKGALYGNTTASNNSAFGFNALAANTTGTKNSALGMQSLDANTTGSDNTAIGYNALTSNTTAVDNTAVGKDSLLANTTGDNLTAVGDQSGYYNTTGRWNTFIGKMAGFNNTTGQANLFIGSGYAPAGHAMTTGSQNVIIGGYNGNQGGLDIRTSDSNIVLSDGAGNPRLRISSDPYLFVQAVYDATTSSAANVFVSTQGLLQRSTSSLRYKNTVSDATHGLAELLALRPVTYKGNNDGDTIFGGLIAEEVHDAGLTEFVQYDDDDRPDALAYGNMVSLCIKAIQEQQATITALEARIATLEAE